jgi:hypothetical protein
VRHLHKRGTTIVLTSNRYTAAALSDDGLRSFAYIELRLDFAAEEQQDAWRGLGNCRLVFDQTERALRLGVAVTIIAVMMRTNYNQASLHSSACGEARRKSPGKRVSGCQKGCLLSQYEQFWIGFQRLLEFYPLAVCNEPHHARFLDLKPYRRTWKGIIRGRAER